MLDPLLSKVHPIIEGELQVKYLFVTDDMTDNNECLDFRDERHLWIKAFFFIYLL